MATLERRAARNFIQKVKKLIPKDEEHLFDALRQYQSSHDLPKFMTELKNIINEPNKICLFEEIRHLIPLNQQIAYDSLCPIIPSESQKVIHLQNGETGSLGFSLRGGAEHGTGVFVTDISTTSEAYKKDLRCGDQIISINGFHIFKAFHVEIIDLINDLEEIVLKIKRIGMVPFRIKASDVVRWKYVPKEKIISNISTYPIKIFINMSTAGGLGCRIVSGPPNQKGIYVQFVNPENLAQEAGLESGDQILSVNETSFIDVTHSQAVMALKTSSHLLLRVRKQVATSWIDVLRTSTLTSPSVGESQAINLPIAKPQFKRSLSSDLQISNGVTERRTMDEFHYNDNGFDFSEPPLDYPQNMDPGNIHDNSPPVNDNFIMYKNPELSLSNENVETLSDNEARKLFTSKEIGGRQIRTITIKINGSLGIEMEGGSDSPLEGRILISNILSGCVYEQGGIHVGDEILMADNSKLIGSTLKQATAILRKAETKIMKSVEFIIAVAPPKNYECEVTYF